MCCQACFLFHDSVLRLLHLVVCHHVINRWLNRHCQQKVRMYQQFFTTTIPNRKSYLHNAIKAYDLNVGTQADIKGFYISCLMSLMKNILLVVA